MSCCPTAKAAACSSETKRSVRGHFGLTSTAMRAAPGSNSRKSPSRFAPRSATMKLTPVTLPPGRLRFATRPSLTGSPPITKTIGTVVVAALAADKACFLQTLAECGHPLRHSSECPVAQEADGRHRRLLRARRERPRRRPAAECSQQFPPSDGDCRTPLPCEVRRRKDSTAPACCPNSAAPGASGAALAAWGTLGLAFKSCLLCPQK